jgi:tetratricopeptide (TPR) repeat protein
LETLEHLIKRYFEIMEKQSNASSLPNILDTVAVVGAVVGSAASLVSQQVAFAAIPLSASIVLNIVNRRQMMNQIADQQQNAIATVALLEQQINTVRNNSSEQTQSHQKSLNQLDKQMQTHQASFEALSGRFESASGQIADLQQSTANLVKETQQLKDATQTLEGQNQELETVVVEMREIQEITQKMSANPNSAEFYFQRGRSQERIGDKQKAIEDYTVAIRLDANYAPAYNHRGILNNEVGHRKKAIDDLRKASQLYFEQGNIDNYETTKELSKNLYQLRSAATEELEAVKDKSSQTLLVNGLFS